MHRLLRGVPLASVPLLIAYGCTQSGGSEQAPPVDAAARVPQPDANQAGPPSPDQDADDGPEGPSIRYIGRFDTQEPDAPRCGWPGCRVIANFQGSEVSVTLTEHVDDWMVGGPSEWDYAIDGQWQPKLVLAIGQQKISLGTKLGPGQHTVELYKRSEAQTGVTEFDGFDFGTDGVLLSPPRRKKRTIEMVGDSMMTGFGVNGVGPDCPDSNQAAEWADFHISFGALLGQTFDADVYGTAYSGKGITKNIWRPDPWTMPLIFPLANPIDPHTPFDFKGYSPDILIVGIGGLDFAVGQPVDDGPAVLSDFIAGYLAFLGQLRKTYPNAQILCIIGPGIDDGEPNVIRDSVMAGVSGAVEGAKRNGDTKVSYFWPSNSQSIAEVSGCDGHGNPSFHQRVARELAPVVSALMGW
ncbi:lipase/acylhydrolase, putative [Labilithrix luteola]|uniref:Lipase/acylhydrolase, putative n=1 Tax=Labilithrix luteola TaxID=1391654 RepID=A0A0K1PMZ0_9BACT|nr:GDSL-type esterase/lipase family protein [Labilithrix luteola]AKU94882.1 lipase/acylhydrolase, putative [Labilithrix luteola]